MGELEFNQAGWDELVEQVIKDHGMPRMERVAAACNSQLGEEGYFAGNQGPDNHLVDKKHATVITATAQAMIDNAKNQTLVNNFNLAGGE